jgi:hypothetical protein
MPPEFLPIINSTSIVALCLLLVGLFVTGRLRPGHDLDKVDEQLKDMTKDRDDWKELATRSTSQMDNLVAIARENLTQVGDLLRRLGDH